MGYLRDITRTYILMYTTAPRDETRLGVLADQLTQSDTYSHASSASSTAAMRGEPACALSGCVHVVAGRGGGVG